MMTGDPFVVPVPFARRVDADGVAWQADDALENLMTGVERGHGGDELAPFKRFMLEEPPAVQDKVAREAQSRVHRRPRALRAPCERLLTLNR